MWLIHPHQHGYLLPILLSTSVFKYALGDETPRQLELYDLYHPFELNCTLRNDVHPSKYEWYTNETLVTADNKRVELKDEGDVILRVLQASEDDFGNYTCYVGEVVAKAWRVEARPHAQLQGNTIDLKIGQDFEIPCKLIGKPYEAVTWLYTEDNGSIVNVDFSSRFSVRDSPQGVPGGVLIGRDGKDSDAGLYTCVPPRYGPSASVMLRVVESHGSFGAGFGWGMLTMASIFIIVIGIIIFLYKTNRMEKYKCLSRESND